MKYFTIRPLLGRRNDVPPDDYRMLNIQDQYGTIGVAYEADGLNISYRRKAGTVSKSYGYEAYSGYSTSVSGVTASGCLGLYELYDGINRDNLFFDNGKCFYLDGSQDMVKIPAYTLAYTGLANTWTHGAVVSGTTSGAIATIVCDDNSGSTGTLYLENITGTFQSLETISEMSGTATGDASGASSETTFANDMLDLYSMVTYGSYILFADRAEHVPYKWSNGDDYVTPLITADGATQYKFRYLETFYGHIIGSYSDQSDGDIEVRWSNPLQNVTNLEFPSANQVYLPGADAISGISKMGTDALFLYTLNNIFRIVYYPDKTNNLKFGIVPMVQGQGCASHHSIVNVRSKNYLFNINYGFIEYSGGTIIDDRHVISKEIEDYIRNIDQSLASRIVGTYIPFTDEIIWVIPSSNNTNDLLVFDPDDRRFTIQRKGNFVSYIDAWTVSSTKPKKLVFGNEDARVYSGTGDIAGADSTFSSYRIEPILTFGDTEHLKLMLELWFGVYSGGDYELHVYWRGGDTVKELLASSWTEFSETLNLNNPDYPTLYCSNSARYHQLKWGTDGNSEPCGISSLRIGYETQGRY